MEGVGGIFRVMGGIGSLGPRRGGRLGNCRMGRGRERYSCTSCLWDWMDERVDGGFGLVTRRSLFYSARFTMIMLDDHLHMMTKLLPSSLFAFDPNARSRWQDQGTGTRASIPPSP